MPKVPPGIDSALSVIRGNNILGLVTLPVPGISDDWKLHCTLLEVLHEHLLEAIR